MYKGKLIVIEGTDGSGKATQAGLLLKKLRKHIKAFYSLKRNLWYGLAWSFKIAKIKKIKV